MTQPSTDPPASNSSTTPATGTGTRRRSSGFMPAFESLSQIRGSEASTARRQSFTDQAPKTGFLGSLFHNNFGRNVGK